MSWKLKLKKAPKYTVKKVILPHPVYIPAGKSGTLVTVKARISANKAQTIDLNVKATIDGKTVYNRTTDVYVTPGTDVYRITETLPAKQTGTLKVCINGTCNTTEVKKKKKPMAKIVDGRLWINGAEKPRDTYNVNKGDTIKVYARAKNKGGKGKLYLKLYDLKNNEQMGFDHDTVSSGGHIQKTWTFNIKQDRKIQIRAGHQTGSKWHKDDDYGC